MARRFQTVRDPRSPRRLTDWIGGSSAVPSEEVAVSGQSAVLLSSFDTRVAAAPQAPFTIVRIRGHLTVMPTVTSTSVQIRGAYGICIVNGEAFDAGIASVISPWSESFDDRWMYHVFFNVSFVFNANGPADAHYNEPIDSKAMRKMEIGDVLIAVIENASSNGCSVQQNFRTLVKLS